MRRRHLSNPRRHPRAALLGGAVVLCLALTTPATGHAAPIVEDPAAESVHPRNALPPGAQTQGREGQGHEGIPSHEGTTKAHEHTKSPGEAPINWLSFNYKSKNRTWVNPPLLFAFINFGLLIYLLVRFGRRPLAAYLSDRHTQIKDALEEATRIHDEAQTRLRETEKKLAGLDDEIANLKKSVADDAQAEKERIIANAKAEAEALVEATERTLVIEVERAKRKLEVSAVQAALQAAEKLLQHEITPQDVTRLRDEYYEQIAAPSADRAGGAS
ncbi:MAG: ATP synthase F0 subunit B [Deltaproteobacteria bacterium]|nr:ATP synthase F0 subunit B [Deltaproteobacteria bacterium]